MAIDTSEVLRQQVEAADLEATRKKAAAEYICGVLETHESELRDAFLVEGTPEEDVPAILYKKTADAFQWIEKEATAIAGVTIVRRPAEEIRATDPLLQLGWSACYPMSTGTKPIPLGAPHPVYIYGPSQKGRQLVNGLREKQGYVTLEEQQRINREREEALRVRAFETRYS